MKIYVFFRFFCLKSVIFRGDFGQNRKIGVRAAKRPFFASEASPKHREAMRGPEGPVRSTARPRSGLFAPRSGVLSREAALEPEGLIWPRSGPVLCARGSPLRARRGESRAPRIRNTPGTYIYYIILIRFHPRRDATTTPFFSALQAELFELKGQILPRAVTCSRTAFSKRNSDKNRYFPFLVENGRKKAK